MRLRTAKKGHNGGIFPQTAPPWPVHTCVTIILTKSHNNLNALDHSITLIGQFVILAVHVATLIVSLLVVEIWKTTSPIVFKLNSSISDHTCLRYLVDTKHNDLLNQALQFAPWHQKTTNCTDLTLIEASIVSFLVMGAPCSFKSPKYLTNFLCK